MNTMVFKRGGVFIFKFTIENLFTLMGHEVVLCWTCSSRLVRKKETPCREQLTGG